MKIVPFLTVLLAIAAPALAATLAEQNAALLAQLAEVHHLTTEQQAAVAAVFARSPYISQGNPAVTRHPATPEECRERLAAAGAAYENPRFAEICGGPYMAPLYDPATQSPADAGACIDQLEFPDVPCAYPVVWVRANEAAAVCAAWSSLRWSRSRGRVPPDSASGWRRLR